MSGLLRLARVERDLNTAAPHNLVEVLRASLREHYGAVEVEVFLVDPRLTVLEPVPAHEQPGIPVAGTAVGQAFSQQTIVVEETPESRFTHVPMTVFGDRVGVLRLSGLGETDEDIDLLHVAESAARALLVAEAGTDRYRRARRPERLTLAAEMQWQLLPVRAIDGTAFRLAGQLEPAYSVRGDNFDWSQEGNTLTVAVTNGMGESISASLLTTLAITALRNARRSGSDLVDQAVLADQAIWSQYAGEQYVSTLLVELDTQTGSLALIDAGSPRAWRVRPDGAELFELDAQLPLGMLDGTEYQVQRFELEPGDRLFILTDGIYQAVRADRNYSTAALTRAMRLSRFLDPLEAVRALMSDLRVFLEDHELDDDAVAVCVDWLGPESD